jgi:transposase-like protein
MAVFALAIHLCEPASVHLTHFGGHLILAESRRKESRMGRPSRYPDEFRRGAVPMVLSSSDSSASIARRLGVNETTLRNWGANELAEQARQANPLSVSPSEFEELRRLRRYRGQRAVRG